MKKLLSIVLVLGMLFGLVSVPAQAAEGGIVFSDNAVKCTLGGNANAWSSDPSKVLFSAKGHSLSFEVTIEEAGSYTLAVRSAAADGVGNAQTTNVYVDGTLVEQKTLPAEQVTKYSTFSKADRHTFNLSEGKRTITFENVNATFVIDQVELRRVILPITVKAKNYVSGSVGALGDDIVFGSAGAYTTYNVDIEESGYYKIDVKTVSGYAGYKFNVYVDDSLAGTYEVPNKEEFAWPTFGTYEMAACNLAKGTRTIKLEAASGTSYMRDFTITYVGEWVTPPIEVKANTYKAISETGVSVSNLNANHLRFTSSAAWADYEVTIPDTGYWTIKNYACTIDSAGATNGARIYLDGIYQGAGSVVVAGWPALNEMDMGGMIMSAGTHTIRIKHLSGSYDNSHFVLTKTGDVLSQPIKVEVEGFVSATEGVTEAIGNGGRIVSLDTNKFIRLNTYAPVTGFYKASVVCAGYQGVSVTPVIFANGTEATGSVATTGYSNYLTANLGGFVYLKEGINSLKVTSRKIDFNLDNLTLTYVGETVSAKTPQRPTLYLNSVSDTNVVTAGIASGHYVAEADTWGALNGNGVTLIAAVYKDGALDAVYTAPGTVAEGTTIRKEFDVTTEGDAVYTVRLFLWDNLVVLQPFTPVAAY